MLEDRTDLIADNAPFRGYGAAVTPGRDGPLVFVAGYGDGNRLYGWEDGGLVDSATGVVADESRHAIGVAAGDADADGCEELYVHNTDAFGGLTGDTDLLLDRAARDRPVWTDTFSLEVNADRGNFRSGRSVAAIDRFGTGRYGFCVASYGAQTRFYELGDDGEVTDLATAVGIEFDGCGRSLLPAPLAGDGMDLFVGVEHGPNRLFRNTGGHYEDASEATGLADPDGNSRGVSLVDEGGTLALAIGTWEGPNRIYRRVGASGSGEIDGSRASTEAAEDVPTYENVAPRSFAEPGRTRTIVAADFDNDGRQELFVNAIGDSNRLFAQDGAGEWRAIDPGDASEPNGLGTGAVAADLDGDGTLELLVVHGEVAAQPLGLYKAPSVGDWLRLRPRTQCGAPARGAVVDLETTTGRQRRVIDAGSGYLCASEPVAHFGLGDARPLRATVRWPDGRERTLTDLDPRTERAVDHPVAPRF